MAFFEVGYRKNTKHKVKHKHKVTIAQEETLPNIWNAIVC